MFAAIPLIALIASCSTLDKTYLSDPAVRQPMSALTFNIGYDLFMIRADVRRATHQELQYNSQNVTRPVEVPNDYSPLVVDLGNGLILDGNGNLCIDIVRLYGLDKMDNFTLIEQGTGFVAQKTIVEKRGDRYRVQGRLGGPATEEGYLRADGAGDDKKRAVFVIDDKGITETVRNALGMTWYASIKKTGPAQVLFPGLIGGANFSLVDGNSVPIDVGYAVKFEGDHIALGHDTMVRTDRGVFVYTGGYNGIELRREGDKATYYFNGMKYKTYTIREGR